MKIRIATLSLTILCLALTVPAFAGVLYSDGGIDGFDNAFFVTGPLYANIAGSFQDISNGFVPLAGTPTTLAWGEWIASGVLPTSFSYELGTSAFGGSGLPNPISQIICPGAGCNTTLFASNPFGYDVYTVSVPITSPLSFDGTSEYWLTISNATDARNSGTEAWDIPNSGSGGPATCNFRQSGTNYGDCGLGGESFTLSGGPTTTPEPSTIMLFGSGILGLAGVLRRKLTR